MSGPTTSNPEIAGPLDRGTAEALLARADVLLAASEFDAARAHYARLIGFPDPAITGAALLGTGESLYRLDDEAGALWSWEQVTRLPENPSAYPAWRQVAAARVRAGSLRAAFDAYKEAERRAPAQDRAEIASRLGWLSRELGDSRGAGRYFARSRGRERTPIVSYAILGITVVVSFLALQPEGSDLLRLLELDKGLGNGEWWRLVSPVLVHGSILHLAFNMYFLYLVGPLVEQLYGSARFLVLYVLTAATASLASFLLGPGPSVGASGALFGLCGVLLVGRALHRPVLQGQQRAIMSQIGFLVVINLVFGFGFNSLGGNVDNFAHLGGLAGGLWLGLLIPPIGASDLPLVGRHSGGGMPGSRTSQVDAAGTADSATVVGGTNAAIRVGGLALGLLRWAGVAALVVVVLAAVVLGGGRHA
ncbi:MAG TPA: rhomboid family intramembrane serine protease [Candidatus Limnocylindrales bacterium]